MPLSRLTIKAATQMALAQVDIEPSSTGRWWVVRCRHHGRKEVLTGEWTKAAAQAKKRERRIFLALLLLAFDEAVADRLARAANDDARDWRKVVAAHVERRHLCG
jgi:hypothetical protein